MSAAVTDVGDVPFLLMPQPSINIVYDDGDALLHHGEAVIARPVTVLAVKSGETIDAGWINKTIDSMLAKDDVFNRGFLSTLLFQASPTEAGKPFLSTDAKNLLAAWGTTSRFIKCKSRVACAPYFLLASSLLQAMRIYPDPQEAFMFGVTTSNDGSETYKKAPIPGVPVPSRLYAGTPTISKPLLGKRVAVKDIFDLRGTETSASCRAYASYYGEQNATAQAVTKLIDLGAVIVGKTRTAQFAAGEHPMDWVDYKCPFNPRGDGSLSPYGSSTGSATALAAYDWLDFAIGTDSLGSMVAPASGVGVYGIRTTLGLLPTTGIVKVCSFFDVPGVFSRDIRDLQSFSAAWFGDECQDTTVKLEPFPSKILYASERFSPFPHSKLEVMETFIADLERATSIERVEFDVQKLWSEVSPSKASRHISEYLATTLAHIQLKNSYLSTSQFRSDYERDRGVAPYINPLVRYKWKYGESLTDEQYQEACTQRDVFRTFVREHVVGNGEIMVLPGLRPEEMYYEEYLGSPDEKGKDLQGFSFKSNNVYSVLAGLPMLVVPVGQRLIHSKTTGAFIHEPITLSIVGPPGSDLKIMEVVREALESSHRPFGVRTGKTAFDVFRQKHDRES